MRKFVIEMTETSVKCSSDGFRMEIPFEIAPAQFSLSVVSQLVNVYYNEKVRTSLPAPAVAPAK